MAKFDFRYYGANNYLKKGRLYTDFEELLIIVAENGREAYRIGDSPFLNIYYTENGLFWNNRSLMFSAVHTTLRNLLNPKSEAQTLLKKALREGNTGLNYITW